MTDNADYTWEDFDQIFFDGAGTCSRALGSTINEYYSEIVEITVNYPQDKLNTYDHTMSYRNLWDELSKQYNVNESLYFVEYCKTGQAHIHGYMKIPFHVNTYQYNDSVILESIAKEILKKLPKKYWKKNVGRFVINEHFRMLRCPAVCLNLKNTLSTNWLNYMSKNAPENSV